MLQEIDTIDSKYNLFIEKVAASKLVWGLSNKKGWANADSNESEDITVVPFWSERAYAKACAKEDWRDFSAAEIPLADFLETWCVGMADDELLAGINWDANMLGKEIDTLSLALDLLNRLKAISSAIKFKNYAGVDEFITEIEASLSDNE